MPFETNGRLIEPRVCSLAGRRAWPLRCRFTSPKRASTNLNCSPGAERAHLRKRLSSTGKRPGAAVAAEAGLLRPKPV